MAQVKKATKPLEYKSVEKFANSALHSYPQLTNVNASGFVEYMRLQDKYYLEDERDFIPYLEKYLGL